MENFLIVAAIFGSIVWLIERTIDRRSLNRERLNLIEKGGNLNDLGLEKAKKHSNHTNLKYGLVAIGLSIGSLLGAILEKYQVLENNEVGYIFSIALFVGISLLLSHYLIRNENSKNDLEK